MQQIHTTIFQLLKYSLHEQQNIEGRTTLQNTSNQAKSQNAILTKPNISSDTDWDAVLSELSNHSIVGLPAEYAIQNLELPQDIKTRWTSIVYGQVGKWTKIMEAQQKLINLLHENNIDVAIIKGSVAATNYPHPEYRTMGDVDFFVKSEDFEKTYQLMLENGYTFAAGDYYGKLQVEKDRFHHVGMKKKGFTFELHKNMSDKVQSEQINRAIQTFIDRGFDEIEIGKIDKYQFPMFSKKINGLIFIRHIIQHLMDGAGIGLRHIIDWMMYAERYLDDDYWNETFEEAVSKIGLRDAAIIFTRMCQLYLGLGEKDRTWCLSADEFLCEDFMELIVGMGNFGRKTKKEDEGANVFFKNKNIFTMLKSLQRLGLKHWKVAEKFPFLRPFAWCYQICRYARKGLGRRAPIKSLKTDLKKSRNKKMMIERLNIDNHKKNGALF